MTWGPEGDIFVMDNQGGWLPASKLVHIKRDRFYNHFTTPAGPFDDKPVTKPVLWLPQNEIANSPSTPITLESGPFKGQMLFGDVTYGGLQRAFLEKVDGEYQGAVFRHSAGLEAGINRVVAGPDGALYVGGIGSTGNWNEPGKLRFGLQKLTPNGGNVFDMEKMEAVEGGFKITYTQPLSDATVAKLASGYKRHSTGATADVGLRRPEARRGEARRHGRDRVRGPQDRDAADRRPASRPRRAHPLAAPVRRGQRRGAVEHRGVVHAQRAPGLREAGRERLLRGRGGRAARRHAASTPSTRGYSGSGFAGQLLGRRRGVRFEVDVDEDGTYPVHFRYASGVTPGCR